ncbi:hypothetical protein M758_10G116700 [Ceratodon purpureus]|nr:hypothetical protein M758_10G116700 [Ceratodon purpureus]
MAMTMEELFYGENEPVYFAHYARQTGGASEASFYDGGRSGAMPEYRSRSTELISFDLMVPMCCNQCEDQVRDALFAFRTVRDVVCDSRTQLVTVTGYCLDPALVLKQVRRVKNGAMFWSDAISSYSAHRYQSSQGSSDHRRSYVQSDPSERRSYPGQYSRSSSDAYTRSLCPAYRDTTKTYYVSLNPTIATVEVMDY